MYVLNYIIISETEISQHVLCEALNTQGISEPRAYPDQHSDSGFAYDFNCG